MSTDALEPSARDVRWEWLAFGALTPLQVHDVLRLRQDVFILEQRCFYRDADGADPESWHGLGTTVGGELVACARLVPPDVLSPGLSASEPSIGRVVVARLWRSRGLGHMLMRTAIDEARRRYPERAVRVSAQTQLERFYQQLGFIPIGEVYDDAGIPHREMRRGPE
jgi:ElaA protein